MQYLAYANGVLLFGSMSDAIIARVEIEENGDKVTILEGRILADPKVIARAKKGLKKAAREFNHTIPWPEEIADLVGGWPKEYSFWLLVKKCPWGDYLPTWDRCGCQWQRYKYHNGPWMSKVLVAECKRHKEESLLAQGPVWTNMGSYSEKNLPCGCIEGWCNGHCGADGECHCAGSWVIRTCEEHGG